MNNKNIVIGIEGLVGAGKTSICRELLKINKNAILLNGGNLYRAIVYTLMQKEPNIFKLKKLTKNADIKEYMDNLGVEIKIENRETIIYINGKLADEKELQSKASSLAVSIIGGIADNTKLFEFARKLINQLVKTNDIIVSGRSIMSIYPNIDYHFFVKASLDARVKRKCIQYNEKSNKREVKINIIKRDILQKLAGFYKTHPNTITVDVTSCSSVKESTDKILKIINTSKQEKIL